MKNSFSVEKIHFILFGCVIFLLFSCLYCVGNEMTAEKLVGTYPAYYPVSLSSEIGRLKNNASCTTWASELDKQIHELFDALEHQSLPKAKFALQRMEHLKKAAPKDAHSVAENLNLRLKLWTIIINLQESELQAPENESLFERNTMTLGDVCDIYTKTDQLFKSLMEAQNGWDWARFFRLNSFHGQLQNLLSTHGILVKPQEALTTFLSSGTPVLELSASPEQREIILDGADFLAMLSYINAIFYIQQTTVMTLQQKDFMNTPMVADWLDSLKHWHSNLVDPWDYLSVYEKYLAKGETSDEHTLAALTEQMMRSKSQACRDMGNFVHEQFSSPHLKVYISKYLINRILPPREPEFNAVNDLVAGQKVSGRRRTDTQVSIDLIPDPNRLLMSLNITGRVQTSTMASTFPATVYNQSYATYAGKKRFELTSRGIRVAPSEVSVGNNRVRLRNLETDFDIVPIVGDIVREVAISQYETQQSQFESETKKKISTQAKHRFDQESEERFLQLNQQFHRFQSILDTRGASLEQRGAKTTEEWLMSSWFLATPTSLGSHTPEPATPNGAIADLKIHQSAINAAIERLDLKGKCMTIAELKQYFLEMLQSTQTIAPGENDDVEIAFAEDTPLSVRFLDQRVEISLDIDYLEVEGKEWSDFRVHVYYKPEIGEDGRLCLIRDGVVQLDSEMNFRSQVPLRAIFSKIFAPQKSIPLSPKFLTEDHRFAGMKTDHLRIENGWFALALAVEHHATPATDKKPIKISTR